MTQKMPIIVATEFEACTLQAVVNEPSRSASTWVIAQTAFPEKWARVSGRGALIGHIDRAGRRLDDYLSRSPPADRWDAARFTLRLLYARALPPEGTYVMTAEQWGRWKPLLESMLGIDAGQVATATGYRNHYYAPVDTPNHASLQQAVVAGLVETRPPVNGLQRFRATRRGCEWVGLRPAAVTYALDE